MGSVGVKHPRAQPFPLLNHLGDGKYEQEGPYWEKLVADWDEDFAYDEIRVAIEKYQENASKAAPAGENEATLLDQLRKVLRYNTKKLRLEAKKIQLLNVAIRDFEKYNKKAQKSKSIQKRLDIACMIVEAMCHLHPKIAFEPCPDNNSTEKPTAASSAFQSAVTSESQKILDTILDALLASFEGGSGTYLETEVPDIQMQEANGTDKAAFNVSTEKNATEVVELILEAFASLPSGVRDKALNIFKKLVEKNKSLLNETTWRKAVTTPSEEVVRYLLKLEDSMFLTEEHATFVVEKGTASMWNMFPDKSRRIFISAPNCDLLHKAVSLGKVDMVVALLKLEPSQVEVNAGEKDFEYPLQHLKKLQENQEIDKDGSSYNRIRNLLVHAMIRSHNLGIQKIRDILRESKVEAVEMSFNFPQFKSGIQNQSSTDYVQGLKTMEASFFRYERVLKYATFPDLSDQAPPLMGNDDLQQDHMEVKDVFDWLRKQGVEEVMSLSVEDRLHCPHNDEDVAACVNNFGVRVLRWRKLDLYLKSLCPNNTDDKSPIEELHLYSGGNRSVHDQWLAQLPNFEQLKRLHVYVVKDVLSPNRLKLVSKQLEDDLNDLNKTLHYRWTSDEGDTSGDTDGNPKIKISEIQWVKQRENFAYPGLVKISLDVVGSHLAPFIQKFSTYYKEHPKTKKTKVALIDSGVVVVGGRRDENGNVAAVESDLARRIVEGISLVRRDNEEHTWWHATEPHGTQMATLICSINPFCDLYVVKVAESNASGITGHNVAKAIEWAQSKEVDIISLSLVAFSDPNKEMARAIKKARDHDIVITCSTADEGSIGAHSVGENNHNALSIAACDRWGNLLPQSQKTGFNYQFIGQNVSIGQVPYLESVESIEGSSVSTAVAAGMASLILACARISSTFKTNDKKMDNGRPQNWRFETVTNRFNSMSEGKWVVLDKLCGKGRLEKPYDFKKLVDDSFKMEN